MPSPSRALARPLLSAIFVASGVNTLRNPAYQVEATRAAGLSDPEKLVQVHGITNLAGGLALATGRLPRLAALGLAAGLVPTTYVGHPFWSADAETKQMQQVNFLKNLSLIGGLLIAAADTGGRESVPHAVGRVGRRAVGRADGLSARAGKKADKLQAKASKRAEVLSKEAAKQSAALQKSAKKASKQAGKRAGVLQGQLQEKVAQLS